jgi:prepilin peptidase CpaA
VASSFLFSGEFAAFGALALSLAGLAAACYTDLSSRRIPNRLNLIIGFGLLALHLSARGLSGLSAAGLAFVICFSIGLLLYFIGALGAGDVKLLAALSLALDPGLAWHLLARIALAGGILGIARLIADGNFRNALFGLLSRARRAKAQNSSVPYAVAITAGWLWMLSSSFGWLL